jgi:hypothetical protein
MSELIKLRGSSHLIISFGGMALDINKAIVFEFVNHLSTYDDVDLIFYIDMFQSCYHKGLKGITTNIPETVEYLCTKIKGYSKVIFMGTSAGGYAAILFGSLCKVDTVIAFIPPTILKNPFNKKYKNLKEHLNETTKYVLYGSLSYKNEDNPHHISHIENVASFKNVEVIVKETLNFKHLRDTGEIKRVILANLVGSLGVHNYKNDV